MRRLALPMISIPRGVDRNVRAVRPTPPSSHQALSRAISGTFFLADSAAFEEWTLVRRETSHRRALEALAHLADYYEQRGNFEAARQHATRQLELDPWREEAHRQVMRVLALSGERSAALVQYEAC